MPAHCSLLMADVPLSVSRSMITSSAGMRKPLKCARRRIVSRCSGVVSLMGSTILILNGSMIVFTCPIPRATRLREVSPGWAGQHILGLGAKGPQLGLLAGIEPAAVLLVPADSPAQERLRP